MKLILKDIKFFDNNDPILSNINLALHADQNIVFTYNNELDINSIHSLFKVITGLIKPSNGIVDFQGFGNKRILVGYKNLEHIFDKDILVIDLLNTLVKTQKISDENLNEIKEILNMFEINKSASTKELTKHQKNLLNLITLLMVKPHYIVIDTLSLPGTSMMQATILKYLKQYCSKYHISLIICSNDDTLIDNIANRIIMIEKSKIVKDLSLNKVHNSKLNNVDNKTKAYNLEDDIISSLSNVNPIKNAKAPNQYQKELESFVVHQPKEKYYSNVIEHDKGEQDLIYQVTKALDDINHEDIVISMKNTDDLDRSLNWNNTSVTNDLLTVQYETNLDKEQSFTTNKVMYENNDSDEVRAHITSLNKKFTDSLEFKNEEMAQKTREFNDHSKEVLQDIKISQNKNNNKTSSINQEHLAPTNNLSDEVDQYMTTEFLNEIRETYAMRKALGEQIKSADFSKLTADLQHKVFLNHEAADKLIKEIDPEGKYDPDKIVSRATKKTVISNDYDNNKHTVTRAMVNDDNNFNDYENDEILFTSKNLSDELSDDEGYDLYQSTKKMNQKYQPKKSHWRDYFTNKKENKNNQQYDKKHITNNYEPSAKFSNENKTNVIKPQNKSYKTNYFNANVPNEPKRLKTMVMKPRSKRNHIEKLFDEAIQDKMIIDEYNEKKSK